MRTFNPVTLFILCVSLIACATGCGDDGPSNPSGGGGGGGTSSVSVPGIWNSNNVNSNGVPGRRYYFDVAPSPLNADGVVANVTGFAYWRWNGFLERVGALTGTVSDNGVIAWTLVLDDNGWEGVETATGKFSGNKLSGDYVWRALDNSIIEDDVYSMTKEPDPVELPAGTGSLGNAGPWRGSIFYFSLGSCNSSGFLCTVNFDAGSPVLENNIQVGVAITGKASGRRFSGGGAPNDLEIFQGPLSATLSGTHFTDGRVVFTLSGGIRGSFEGTIGDIPNGSSTISGPFDGAAPCSDAAGTTTSGLFILTSAAKLQ